MSDKSPTPLENEETADDIDLFNPFDRHFVSGNKRDEFLKALEKGQHEPTYSTIH